MLQCLKKFGFGKYFLTWINIIYNKPTFCIKNNGWLSAELTMQRGVRQGCAVSALLFVLAVEIFSVKLKQHKNIKGIKMFDDTIHLIQYADDTTLTLKNEQSVKIALELLSEFSLVSGLYLNLSKCSGIWLGPMKDKPNVYYDIAFTTKPVKCLGIYIGTNYDACEKLNWDGILNKLENLAFQWRKRKLTLQGKITVINNLFVPKIIYPLTVLYTPSGIVSRIEKNNVYFLMG